MDKQLQTETEKFMNQPKNKNEYGYFDAFRNGFKRILDNKRLWLWGIFLSGLSFPNIFNEWKEKENLLDFFEIWWIIFGIGLIFLISILFWAISTIVRPGLIRAIDRLQNNSNSEIKHLDIWSQGKEKFLEVIKLDLFYTGVVLAIVVLTGFLMVALVGIGFNFKENSGILIPLFVLGIVLLFIFIFFVVFAKIIRTLGTVFISLSEMKWLEVSKKSYFLIKNNKVEFLKLLLLIFLIGIISGIVEMIGLGVVSGVIITSTLVFMENIESGGVFFFGFSILIIFIALLFIQAFFSLWSQDIVLWWIKKMQGIKINKKKESLTTVGETLETMEGAEVPSGIALRKEN